MTHLVAVMEELLGRQVGFRALCDGAIDTTSASGELIFHINWLRVFPIGITA
jgi:DNA invertase Pin-like site-specific DNA recombinase